MRVGRGVARARPGRPAGRATDERGQSTVELALVLPVVVLVMLAIVQAGLVVRDQVLVTHAAREAVRAAAVEDDPATPGAASAAAGRAAAAAAGLDPGRLHVVVDTSAADRALVRVDVAYVSRTDLPLIGPLLPDLSLHAAATMRSER